MYGPRFVNTDFSVIKDFPLSFREGMNLQFRAEFFNLFNHPQFLFAGASAGSGEQDYQRSFHFGVINNTVNNARSYSVRAQVAVLRFEGRQCPLVEIQIDLATGRFYRMFAELMTARTPTR